MPGQISVLTQTKVSGYAIHPYWQDYPPVVHVIHRGIILCSLIADQPPPSGESEQSNSWFHLSLMDFSLADSDLKRLTFLIGETDELLDINGTSAQSEAASRLTVTVEDLIYASSRKPWITGATYIDAVHAGMSDADIIDLLYRDILGRPADPEGLANYLFQTREGIRTLGDIRKSLFDSSEYADRRKEATCAAGAIFSQPITLVATNIGFEQPTTDMHPEQPNRQSFVDLSPAVEPEPISWPSYPERSVELPSQIPSGTIEVVLPVDSVLFGSGWHNVEHIDGTAFRWMETSGIVFSPKPDLPCLKISMELAAVYGAHEPMVDCYLDDIPAQVDIEPRGDGFKVSVTPAARDAAVPYTKLRIESRVSGCPVEEGRGTDQRILSLNALGVVVEYETIDSSIAVA